MLNLDISERERKKHTEIHSCCDEREEELMENALTGSHVQESLTGMADW